MKQNKRNSKKNKQKQEIFKPVSKYALKVATGNVTYSRANQTGMAVMLGLV